MAVFLAYEAIGGGVLSVQGRHSLARLLSAPLGQEDWPIGAWITLRPHRPEPSFAWLMMFYAGLQAVEIHDNAGGLPKKIREKIPLVLCLLVMFLGACAICAWGDTCLLPCAIIGTLLWAFLSGSACMRYGWMPLLVLLGSAICFRPYLFGAELKDWLKADLISGLAPMAVIVAWTGWWRFRLQRMAIANSQHQLWVAIGAGTVLAPWLINMSWAMGSMFTMILISILRNILRHKRFATRLMIGIAAIGVIGEAARDSGWLSLYGTYWTRLNRTRPSEALASEIRWAYPESGISWEKRRMAAMAPDGPPGLVKSLVARWVATEARRYGKSRLAPDEAEISEWARLTEVFNRLPGVWISAADVWAEAGRMNDSERGFRTALMLNSHEASAWRGLALARLSRGDRSGAIRALVAEAWLEPERLFDPSYQDIPLSECREEVRRSWIASLSVEGWSVSARASLAPFVRDLQLWIRESGSAHAFVMTGPLEGRDVTTRRLWEKYRELPLPAKNGEDAAVISAGVCLFSDRHVNRGQAATIYDSMIRIDTETKPISAESILVTRPIHFDLVREFGLSTRTTTFAALTQRREDWRAKLFVYGPFPPRVQVPASWLESEIK